MSHIDIDDYFGPWIDSQDVTEEVMANAIELLDKVNPLLSLAATVGVKIKTNPKTGTLVSGTKYGGFRPQSCKEGAKNSAHKTGEAIDVYDPSGMLDHWIDDHLLETFGLYREHPDATNGWCHLSKRAPKSGKRTFYP